MTYNRPVPSNTTYTSHLTGASMPTSFKVINLKTGLVVKTFRTAQAARNFRDRADLQHGAINFTVRPVYA